LLSPAASYRPVFGMAKGSSVRVKKMTITLVSIRRQPLGVDLNQAERLA
jgi:hypothetical protein